MSVCTSLNSEGPTILSVCTSLNSEGPPYCLYTHLRRRRLLRPIIKEVGSKGLRANLSRDRLYIDVWYIFLGSLAYQHKTLLW